MLRYRTEIVVPEDRYVYLQLPADAPTGAAIVIVAFPGRPGDVAEEDAGRGGLEEDVEWWEEFDDRPDAR